MASRFGAIPLDKEDLKPKYKVESVTAPSIEHTGGTAKPPRFELTNQGVQYTQGYIKPGQTTYTPGEIEVTERKMDYASDDTSDKEPIPPPPPPEAKETFKTKMAEYGQELGRQLGLTGRYIEEGTAEALGTVVDPMTALMTKIPGYTQLFGGYVPLKEAVSRGLTKLGVPEPETAAEKVIGEISTTIAGAGTGAGAAGTIAKGTAGLTQAAARQMAAQPGAQLAGAAGAQAGQIAAEKADVGPVGQMAASIAGGMLGAGAVQAPKVKLGPSTTPQGLAEAEKRGIQVLTEDVYQPKTAGGKIAQSAMGKVAGGTGAQRAAQQAQRVKATQDFIRQYGADTGQEMLPEVFNELQKKRSFKVGIYNKLKTDVIKKLDDKGAVPVDKTIEKIDQEIADIAKFDDENPLISFYEDFKNKIQGKTLNSIEELRKDLGDNIDQASKDPTKGINKRRGDQIAKRVYKTLNEDMGSFIKEQGEPKDFNKWKAGNKKLSNMMKELEVGALKRTLNNGEATPETVKTMLFSTKPSEARLLYKNLNPKGKRNAQAALIQEALWRTSKGRIEELSPDIFKNKIRDLQKQTGIFFTGEDRKAINGLYNALKITEGAGKAVAAPATGMQNLPVLVMSVLGGAGAGGGAMMGGAPGAMAGAIAGPIAIGTLSKTYNSKPVRDTLLQLSRIKSSDPEAAKAAKRLIEALQAQQKEETTP